MAIGDISTEASILTMPFQEQVIDGALHSILAEENIKTKPM